MLPSLYDRLVSGIKKHEGFRARPYFDSLGVGTIGYGTTWITEDEADKLLRNRLQACITEIDACVKEREISLDEVRCAVLYEMCYQLGIDGVKRFRKMWDALKDMDYETASREMKASRWHKQTPARCEYLAGVMLRGF